MTAKDCAICIRAVDFSETSQIVTFFARVTGKISTIAKGSKRPKSAFDGPIEVLAFGNVVFSDRRKETLATLIEFQQQPLFSLIHGSVFRLNCCLLAVELLDRVTKDHDPHPELFDRLEQFVRNVAQVGPAQDVRRDTLAWLIVFQLSLLKEIGLRPLLHACANCRTPFSPAWSGSYFSSAANGLICQDCEAHFASKIRLTPAATLCLTNLKELTIAAEETLNVVEGVLVYHFTEILGRRPRMARHVLGS